ncbi:NUDIX hydrolase, partial [Frankia canadensis]|uniref:NUDIX hydrolase n=1 Tax=Frankia canadensis TaxID=1836972 RepID=UPI001056A206
MRVVRRTARAILIDPDGRLVLFRRTLPKRKPYWSTPGGGVDAGDDSIEAALHRELAEELGATVDRVQQVFLTSPPRGGGITVAHFFVCRLVSMDLSLRTGEEFTNPAKGRYDVDRIDLHGKKLSRYPLQPLEVKEFILANRQALLMAALDDETPPLTSPPAPGRQLLVFPVSPVVSYA